MELQQVVSHFLNMSPEERMEVLSIEREVANNSEREVFFAGQQVEFYSRMLRNCFKEDRPTIKAVLNGWNQQEIKALKRGNQAMDRVDAFLHILIKEGQAKA